MKKFRMSPRHLTHLRKTVEQFMSGTCKIERPAGRSFDPVTGDETPSTQTHIWEGKFRMTPTDSRGEAIVGEEAVSWRDTDFYIPLDTPEIHQDDLITILAFEDETMVGRVWRITDVRFASYQVTRKLSAQSLAESRTTDDHL